jgi:hypothetical protein
LISYNAKRKHFVLPVIFSTLLLSAFPLHADGAEERIDVLQGDAMKLVKLFAGELKPQLKEAMQEGGPLHAIEVCARQAPAIAQSLSDESGWIVKRVSLKARNNTTAVADEWETEVLRQFDQRQQRGEDTANFTYSETVGGQYRFMKAQAVEPICLACHGQTIAPEVVDLLDRKYPHDIARGYNIGQIRGAFSLSKRLWKSL